MKITDVILKVVSRIVLPIIYLTVYMDAYLKTIGIYKYDHFLIVTLVLTVGLIILLEAIIYSRYKAHQNACIHEMGLVYIDIRSSIFQKDYYVRYRRCMKCGYEMILEKSEHKSEM